MKKENEMVYIGTFYDYLSDGVWNVIGKTHDSCVLKLLDIITERYPDIRVRPIMEDLDIEDFYTKYDMETLLFMVSINEKEMGE